MDSNSVSPQPPDAPLADMENYEEDGRAPQASGKK